MRPSIVAPLVLAFLCRASHGFTPSRPLRQVKSSTRIEALWRHWMPRSEEPRLWNEENDDFTDVSVSKVAVVASEEEASAQTFFLGSLLAFLFLVAPSTGALAVSGGGLDFAGLDISGQNYADKNYKGKDFTQVIAKGTNFAKSNLQGCRFYKSYLVNADFSGADITGAALEDTSMDGALLKDTVAKGSYFSNSILDTATVENADFTDAQFPPKVLPLLCDRVDMKGTNPTTGTDTRESAMCP